MQRNAVIALVGTLLVTAALLLAPKRGSADVVVPASDAEVLARVTPRRERAPVDAEAAATQAQRLIEASRREGGDVRLLGQAQAVLSTWWKDEAPPARVRLLRATIKQSLHDFEGALVDLDALVADPTDVQAQLTRATVLTVLARYDEADAACSALKGQVDPVVFVTCRAPVVAIRGKASDAVRALTAVLEVTPKDSPLRPWALSVLGETQWFSGDASAAAETLKQVLTLDAGDRYSRLLLAEVLTATGRASEVPALFTGRALTDAELLTFVESGQAPKAAAADLEGRIEASRRRGDGVHRREEARFALHVEKDAVTALDLAVKNFSVQREPADARVLLEAALAARDIKAAQPALDWLTRTGFSDPRFLSLRTSLEALR